MSCLKQLIQCPACYSSDYNPCYKCQIAQLKKDNHQLKVQLQYYTKSIPEILTINSDYKKHFDTSTFFLDFKNPINKSDYKFITITLDPSKFGLFNQDEPQMNYIFRSLYNAINQSIITQLIGCFEYQKNGSIHAHAIIKSKLTTQEIDAYFAPQFTDIIKKQYAIKTEIIRNLQNVENYLKKESNSFYRYDKSIKNTLKEIPTSTIEEQSINPLETKLTKAKRKKFLLEFELKELNNIIQSTMKILSPPCKITNDNNTC
ncbi:hypothetical protein [Rheinheimera sp.]|uniref:hypothetical protein n=3 Tax=Gammaproteobacteria TaxID=1236 RepID=UPI0040470DCD